MSEIIVGIDLGTTNSEIAIIRDGQPHVLEENGDPILPSFVGLSEDGKLLVGRAARNQWVLAPERTLKSIKRQNGRQCQSPVRRPRIHAARNLRDDPAGAEGSSQPRTRR